MVLQRAVESSFPKLFIKRFSNWLAPEGYKGRNTLFQAFYAYYYQEYHLKASVLARRRFELRISPVRLWRTLLNLSFQGFLEC